MPIEFIFAGIAVTDFGASLPWWERLMGRPPELLPRDGEAAWEVAGQGWIYVVADAHRAGNALLTFVVDDLAAEMAALAKRGLNATAIDTVPGVVRKATILDPDGNTVTFGQPLGETA